MSSNLITRSIQPPPVHNPFPNFVQTVEDTALFRWSKFVREDQLDEWEIRLIASDVVYSVESLVKRKRIAISSYAPSREEMEALKDRFGGGVTRINPEDWQSLAVDGPGFLLRIRDRILITGAVDPVVIREMEETHPDRIVLNFPPQLAFGTGSHPTSAGCLRLLVDFAKRCQRSGNEWRMLDLGCGSGILAIAAAKLGAGEVLAIELDSMALKYAIGNAGRHGIEDQIEFIHGDGVALLGEATRGKFDLIVANLFSELLIEAMPLLPRNLRKNPAGQIILSGFLTSQAKDVVNESKRCGIGLKTFIRRGNWVVGASESFGGPVRPSAV